MENEKIADEYIKIILARQENLFGTSMLKSTEQAKAAAQALATFRSELIAQLQKQ